MGGVGFCWARSREKGNRPRESVWARVIWGSPDAVYVAPDPSGDHRTKTQRVFYFGQPLDDGHRTLALAFDALGHA